MESRIFFSDLIKLNQLKRTLINEYEPSSNGNDQELPFIQRSELMQKIRSYLTKRYQEERRDSSSQSSSSQESSQSSNLFTDSSSTPSSSQSTSSSSSQTSTQPSSQQSSQPEQLVNIGLINRKSWDNVCYNSSQGVHFSDDINQKGVKIHRKRKHLTMYLMVKIYTLLESNLYATKRDIYYQYSRYFQNQKAVDNVIDDISCLFRVSRIQLHIVSSSKGLIYGNAFLINEDGSIIDCSCSPNGVSIPNDISPIKDIKSKAKFILLIEKDATFQHLIDTKVLEVFPIIMITGKGFPDQNTRAMLRLLYAHLKIPILGLVDGDPHGLEILCIYRYGSLSLAYDSVNLIVPQIRWLGVLPSDHGNVQIAHHHEIPFTDGDKKKLHDLFERPYLKENKEWLYEAYLMGYRGVKIEIQGIQSLSPRYLRDDYLTAKIFHGTWK